MKILLQYLVLSPNMDNEFAMLTHKPIYRYLNSAGVRLRQIQHDPAILNCHLAVVLREGTSAMAVRGPDISGDEVSYAIYLPDPVVTLHEYLKLLSTAFTEIFSDFSSDDFLAALDRETTIDTER